MPSQEPTPPPLSEADQRQILELYQHILRRGAECFAGQTSEGRSKRERKVPAAGSSAF